VRKPHDRDTAVRMMAHQLRLRCDQPEFAGSLINSRLLENRPFNASACCVLGFHGNVDLGTFLETHLVAVMVCERVFNADFSIQVIVKHDLPFSRLPGNSMRFSTVPGSFTLAFLVMAFTPLQTSDFSLDFVRPHSRTLLDESNGQLCSLPWDGSRPQEIPSRKPVDVERLFVK
jgi:hypothetical protein